MSDTDSRPEVQVDVEVPEKRELQYKDPNDGSDKKETTRSKIAMLYVSAFFVVIAVVFFIGTLRCFEVNEFKDMIITVSGVLSGPLGFIVGYYFKASKE